MDEATRELPKLKDRPGLIIVLAQSAGTPDISAAKLVIAYRNDLVGFRNSLGVHEALCITPSNHDPNYDGLHLAATAAHVLVADLTSAALVPGTAVVQVNNHNQGLLNEWHRFSPVDAQSIAHAVDASLQRAGK